MGKEKLIHEAFRKKGLRVTPQRLSILKALLSMNHPNADQLCQKVRKSHPHIAVGTIYKTLETFVGNGLVKKVDINSESNRYDAILDKHHHLYSPYSGQIEDYYDDELSVLIEKYMKEKQIGNFNVEDFRIQFVGKFTNEKQ